MYLLIKIRNSDKLINDVCVCQKTEIIRLLLPPCNANGGSTVANLQMFHTHNSYNLQFFMYRK